MDTEDDRYAISKEWIRKNMTINDAKLLDRVHDAAASRLEVRVGDKLAATMPDEQLGEFIKLIDSSDEDAQLEYLEKVVPHYKRIIEEEASGIKEALTSVKNSESMHTLIETWK